MLRRIIKDIIETIGRRNPSTVFLYLPKYRIFAFLFLFIFGITIQPIRAREYFDASFPCTKAEAPVEKVICSDRTLASYDQEMSGLYEEYMELSGEQERMTFRRDQRKWLKERLEICSIPKKEKADAKKKIESVRCLVNVYQKRIRLLKRITNPDRTEAIRDLLKDRKFELSVGKNTPPAVLALEKRMLKDFLVQKNIEHVQPIAKAHNYEDPVFEPYREKCPNRPFHQYYYWQNTATNPDDRSWYPETDEELMQIGSPFHATENMKLYYVNIDNNSRNGKEYVFYGEHFFKENYSKNHEIDYVSKKRGWKGNSIGVYLLLRLKNCSLPKSIGNYSGVSGTGNRGWSWNENYNGIIKYMQKHYLYFISISTEGYYIKIRDITPPPGVGGDGFYLLAHEENLRRTGFSDKH